MIGKILGKRYELLEEIGKGGMAYVYKARCVLLNRIVAVKILRDDLEGGDEFLTRFNTEAQAAASLTHPNIVSIFDVGVDEGMHYIVMEYVDGITLKEYIKDKQKLSYTEALDIAYQICDALQAAHDKNIVHRDIKPHNILITSDRNIKVADFGIARSTTGTTLSKNEDILGSVHYISPEQVNGISADYRSDIYSLGICLYEMISGKVPFDAETPVAVAMMQTDSEPEPIKEVEIPVSVHQIIFKAMSKIPDMRYQNASEFKNDMLSIVEDVHYQVPDGDFYYKPDNIDFDDLQTDNNIGMFRKVTAIVGGFVTALLIVLISIFIYNYVRTASHYYDVPELVGKTLDEAGVICKEAGVSLVVSDEVEKKGFESGTIVSQTPVKSERIKSGDVIKVIINKTNSFTLDDYTGKQYKSVKKDLKEIGYETEINFEESKFDKDTVLRQSPKSGTKLKKGDTVTLYVSNGASRNENLVTVPSLDGKTYKEAKRILEESDLSVGTISGVQNPSDDDRVISQNIPYTSKVKRGTAVGISLREIESDSKSNEKTDYEYESDDDSDASEKTDDSYSDSGEDNNEY
ncbi:MAG: PASTA domain-containing protein [Ruminococcaceae bacterium]|nr:PASTA domain-containing protein [Oscillospiraceae bacterium]